MLLFCSSRESAQSLSAVQSRKSVKTAAHFLPSLAAEDMTLTTPLHTLNSGGHAGSPQLPRRSGKWSQGHEGYSGVSDAAVTEHDEGNLVSSVLRNNPVHDPPLW